MLSSSLHSIFLSLYQLDPNFLDSDSDCEDEDQEKSSKRGSADIKLSSARGHAADESPVFQPSGAMEADSPASATAANAEPMTGTDKECCSKEEGSSSDHLLEPAAAEAHGEHCDAELTKVFQ